MWLVELHGPDVDDGGNPGSHSWLLYVMQNARTARQLVRKAKARHIACRMTRLRGHAKKWTE